MYDPPIHACPPWSVTFPVTTVDCACAVNANIKNARSAMVSFLIEEVSPINLVPL